ncbi:hypothetical protein P153DRAFT_395974 [Dothidotthia symphoricarpi CBS 119687]|uniref:Guanine nucleotide exchange factor n=1 Tax=Dothidotthia symphoricarpi CBS 119687 TaxID=1392245 RepID=A0A6A6AHL6_9PLEO|nr:uncharacterized protein P153DRAFT_395974 [Dothidotthia symphoricarpi CBS 119687]KAF2130578.1 hypothetical protein P153DRAFT_395974 [Dothidotthia symphoricarpi CBS 119687]
MNSSGRAKLDQVTQILTNLQNDLKAPKLSVQQRKQLLEQLKVHGRSVENSDPIFTKNGLQTLSRYATEEKASATSQEALRCIANALLLVPATRQILVDLDFGPWAAEKLDSESTDDEFLLSRVLFLLTYETTLDYTNLVQENHLADNLNAAITRHAKRYSKSTPQHARGHTSLMDLMALSETLKLLFNITHRSPDLSPSFSPCIPHIFKILLRRGIPTPPLKDPTNFLINALMNLDLEDTQHTHPGTQTAIFPSFDPPCNASHLIAILDKALTSYPDPELDATVSPLLTLLRRIYPLAPPPVQTHMQTLLLPTPAERSKPLGKSDTFFSRLLNLSTSALTPTLRGSISAMLFELSDKDAATFVHNVGYGYASGFLMSNNIPMPESVARANAETDGVLVNPITGQRLDREDVVEQQPMTQEEKEREAERLFVLFERLKATGVMDVQNPVEEAFRSGRIEELADDED